MREVLIVVSAGAYPFDVGVTQRHFIQLHHPMVYSLMDMKQCWPPGHAWGEVLCNSTHWSCPGRWESTPHQPAFKNASLIDFLAYQLWMCFSESLLIVLVHLCGREIIGIPVLVCAVVCWDLVRVG